MGFTGGYKGMKGKGTWKGEKPKPDQHNDHHKHVV